MTDITCSKLHCVCCKKSACVEVHEHILLEVPETGWRCLDCSDPVIMGCVRCGGVGDAKTFRYAEWKTVYIKREVSGRLEDTGVDYADTFGNICNTCYGNLRKFGVIKEEGVAEDDHS